MSKKSELIVSRWPELCNSCGQELARKVLENPKLETFVSWCPEHSVFVLACAGMIEGQRAIIRWSVDSPVGEIEAHDMIAKMLPHAKSCVNLDPARVH